MKTLVIDDDTQESRRAYDITCQFGECVCVNNGVEGLLCIEESLKSNKLFTLVILDVVLPKLGGLQVIAGIRKLELQYNIKPVQEAAIIVATFRTDEPTILEAFRAGATGWLNKPIYTEQLVANIRKCRAQNT